MNITFLITTYNRRRSCQQLVDALQGLGSIIVLNDGCNYNLNGCAQYFQPVNLGKKEYYTTVNRLFALRPMSDYYFILPDDFLPVDGMVEKAIAIWESIVDPAKICLNLYADRRGLSCWTKFPPVDKGNVTLTQWVDMCFLCEERFFMAVQDVRRERMVHSSGVGAYISQRLFKLGFNQYQVKESLVEPQEEHNNSQMHRIENERRNKRRDSKYSNKRTGIRAGLK